MASRALARARLTDEQLEDIDGLRQMCLDAENPRSPLEAAEREERVTILASIFVGA